jgi:hypothetical protein
MVLLHLKNALVTTSVKFKTGEDRAKPCISLDTLSWAHLSLILAVQPAVAPKAWLCTWSFIPSLPCWISRKTTTPVIGQVMHLNSVPIWKNKKWEKTEYKYTTTRHELTERLRFPFNERNIGARGKGQVWPVLRGKGSKQSLFWKAVRVTIRSSTIIPYYFISMSNKHTNNPTLP